MSILYGIDVSEHNGVIDWEKVKSSGSVDFAMIRAGYGQTAVDKKFRSNAAMCNTLGIPIGIYWFSYAKTVPDAEREARACLETIKDYKITYPVAFDFEDDSVRVAKNAGVYISQSLATSLAKTFLSIIQEAGYIAVNYSNPSYLNQYFDQSLLLDYPLWLAQWPVNPKPEVKPALNPVIWQYSSKGKIPGISTDVDLNVSYIDYTTFKKEPTLNNEKVGMESLVKALNFEKQKSWFEKQGEDGKTLLEQAKELGFTDGSNPYGIPSRAEVMTMIVRAYLSLKANVNDQLTRIIEAMELNDEYKRRMMMDDGK